MEFNNMKWNGEYCENFIVTPGFTDVEPWGTIGSDPLEPVYYIGTTLYINWDIHEAETYYMIGSMDFVLTGLNTFGWMSLTLTNRYIYVVNSPDYKADPEIISLEIED
jgi:hypothetical protein